MGAADALEFIQGAKPDPRIRLQQHYSEDGLQKLVRKLMAIECLPKRLERRVAQHGIGRRPDHAQRIPYSPGRASASPSTGPAILPEPTGPENPLNRAGLA